MQQEERQVETEGRVKWETELEARVQQRTFELEVLYELAQGIGYTLSYAELFQLLVESLHRVVQYDVAATLLFVEGHQELCLYPTVPLAVAARSQAREQILRTFRGLTDWNPQLHPLQSQMRDNLIRNPHAPPIQDLKSIFQVPLIVGTQQETVGLLLVGAEREAAFHEGQLRILFTLANQAATSVERLRSLLATQQARLETLVERLPTGVLLLSADNVLRLANPLGRSYLAMLGPFALGEPLIHLGNLPLRRLFEVTPDMPPLEVISDGPPPHTFEVQAQYIEVGPEAGGHIVVLNDVTREREIQERAEEQSRLAAVGQLAAGIAHDFNNLLAAILLNTDMLDRSQEIRERNRSRVQTVSQLSKQAAHLIGQILDFSRQAVIERATFDMLPMLKESVKLLERILPESIGLDLDIEPGEYMVKADPTRMQQVFMNLAVNARDAMPNGGNLDLHLQRVTVPDDTGRILTNLMPGHWLALQVSDNGVGIPPDVLPRVFEPFFTTKPPGQGTGLGLSQVYGIIKQHGGEITVHSTLGKGTIFRIYLPLVSSRPETPLVQTETSEADRPELLLVVEDNQATRETLVEALELLGYRILAAENAEEALTAFRQHAEEIALVITDLVMPGYSGLDLHKALQDRGSQVPLIVLTGYPVQAHEREALSDRKVEWLQKPIGLNDLSFQVQRMLESGRRH